MTRDDDGGGEESHGSCHCRRTGAMMTLMIRWHPTWVWGGGDNGEWSGELSLTIVYHNRSGGGDDDDSTRWE